MGLSSLTHTIQWFQVRGLKVYRSQMELTSVPILLSSSPIINGRVKKTFRAQLHPQMKAVQCFSCRELGAWHPLKDCTVVEKYGSRCNAEHLYKFCEPTGRRSRTMIGTMWLSCEMACAQFLRIPVIISWRKVPMMKSL